MENYELEVEELGRTLATEARKWALDGPMSARASLWDLDPDRATSDDEFSLELYFLHHAAFTLAALNFGHAGECLLHGFIGRAAETGAGIVQSFGLPSPPLAEMSRRCSGAFSEYADAFTEAEPPHSWLRLGAAAVSRVFGHTHKEPALAGALIHVFQSAQQGCHDLLLETFRAMELDPSAYTSR